MLMPTYCTPPPAPVVECPSGCVQAAFACKDLQLAMQQPASLGTRGILARFVAPSLALGVLLGAFGAAMYMGKK